jgi:lysophospholipase L1-like esterase
MQLLKKILFYSLSFLVCCLIAVILFEVSFSLGGTIWKHIYRHTLDDDSFYVYVIGGSTALGEPYTPKISYPWILSEMFEARLDDRPVKIVNLASSGRSLEYGYWQLIRELYVRPHRHGVVLVYSGINEIMNELGKGPRYSVWGATQKTILSARVAFLIEERFRWRSSVERYGMRLKRLYALSQHYQIPMVVSTLVSNISDYPPREPVVLKPEEKDFIEMLSKTYFEKQFAEGVRLFEEKEFLGHSEKPYAYYYAARCYYALGRYEEAYKYFWQSMQLNVSRKPWPRMNEIIREFAQEYSCPLAETQQAFEKSSPHNILGDSLFIDRCHPNIKGYSILAETFADVLVRDLSLAEGYRVLSTAEIIAKSGFSERDQIEAYLTRFFWDTYDALLLSPENAEARIYFQNAKNILTKAEALGLEKEETHVTRLIIAVLGGDSASAVKELRELAHSKNKILSIAWWKDSINQRLLALLPESEHYLIEEIIWNE